MIYANDDPMALLAMEIARTGNYGEYAFEEEACICPVCSACEPDFYYLNDEEECIGCSECVTVSDILYR